MKSLSKFLAIGLLATVSSALAASAANTDYSHLILLIKDDGSRSRNLQDLVDPSSTFQHRVPNIKPLVTPSKARTLADAEALRRHRLDRYYIVDTRHLSHRQADALRQQLQQDPAIEDVDFEPVVQGMHDDKAEPIAGSARGSIPDHTGRQHYLLGRQAVPPYNIGGVNAVKAWTVPGGKGYDMRVISSEIDHWAYNHVDLPKPFLEVDAGALTGYHDTASVGTIGSRDNGFGTTGIVPHAQLGYSQYGPSRLLQTAEQLSPGDVLQLGVHMNYTPFPAVGCTQNCYMPLEYNSMVRDIITYLTMEKGVHVVLAAANGNINLDHPYFNGYFDRNRFDSGSIYAGAVSPTSGLRAYYSQYGRRVDLFSWGGSVTTTTWTTANPTSAYTHTYSGTSSANPIIAGVMASLQGVARANGLGNLAPKELRRILVETGYPQANGNRTEIGVQPDLEAAIRKLLADGAGQPPTGRLAIPEQAKSGETFNGHVYAQSPTQKPLTYRWNADGFTPPDGDGPTLALTAPPVTADTLTSISVAVSDGTHTLNLRENMTIKAPDAPPVGDCAAPWIASKVYASAGEKVSYSGYNYQVAHWTQNARPDLNFGETGAAKPWRRLGTCGNGLPVARITGPSSVEAGKAVLLSGASSTGQGLRFAWAATGFNPDFSAQASSSFIAPNTAGTRVITLTVTDERDRRATASQSLTVTTGTPANRPPVGSLQGSETVDSGKAVSFIANTSDPDGDAMSYTWTRPTGFTGTIGNTRSVTLTAPAVTGDTRVIVSVVVSDGRGGTLRLEKPITVKAPPPSGSCRDIPAWSPTKVYSTYAEAVSYNGMAYKQNFYSLDKRPDLNSAVHSQPWHPGVPCR